MRLRVDYQEIREAICQSIANRLHLAVEDIRVVSLTRGKGDNVWAEIEITPTEDADV